jgi:hypothetical protein
MLYATTVYTGMRAGELAGPDVSLERQLKELLTSPQKADRPSAKESFL